jgi:hypothetical protein
MNLWAGPLPDQRLQNWQLVRGQAKMTWVYWNTFWTLAGSLVWFMTIVSHPDAVVVDRHPQRRR